jgi:hypothetical protein
LSVYTYITVTPRVANFRLPVCFPQSPNAKGDKTAPPKKKKKEKEKDSLQRGEREEKREKDSTVLRRCIGLVPTDGGCCWK